MEGRARLVHYRQEVLVPRHRHHRVRLANQIPLHAIVREYADVVEGREDGIPATPRRETLRRLAIFELVVPLADIFPLVEGLELDV